MQSWGLFLHSVCYNPVLWLRNEKETHSHTHTQFQTGAAGTLPIKQKMFLFNTKSELNKNSFSRVNADLSRVSLCNFKVMFVHTATWNIPDLIFTWKLQFCSVQQICQLFYRSILLIWGENFVRYLVFLCSCFVLSESCIPWKMCLVQLEAHSTQVISLR